MFFQDQARNDYNQRDPRLEHTCGLMVMCQSLANACVLGQVAFLSWAEYASFQARLKHDIPPRPPHVNVKRSASQPPAFACTPSFPESRRSL